MHPAVSVIFFTVMSGAGFGMIAVLGLGVPMPEGTVPAFLISLLAGGLSVAGLLSSTFHLGHPERAWRAFSQWRSSWLSREGVFAVATLVAFAAYALTWMATGTRLGWLGGLAAVLSALTVHATAMIYCQLKTVPQWSQKMTPVVYLGFALASGFLLASPMATSSTLAGYGIGQIASLLVLFAWLAKLAWWSGASKATLASRGMTRESATGLGKIGKVRLLERPHSGENYLTREMAHKIGRKHASKLRMIALVIGLAVPLVLCLCVAAGFSPQGLIGLAAISMIVGLFCERWLFFAEATHSVSLYYDETR
ncbi:MAG: DmsC/YnfH family molybdoenzyme membrane anchor subunit [Nitratireductor sp.]